MNGRFFLDTNVFVYTFDARAPAKAKKAAQLIRRAIDTGEGIISYQVVQEFFNFALRRFAQPMSVAEAEQYFHNRIASAAGGAVFPCDLSGRSARSGETSTLVV